MCSIFEDFDCHWSISTNCKLWWPFIGLVNTTQTSFINIKAHCLEFPFLIISWVGVDSESHLSEVFIVLNSPRNLIEMWQYWWNLLRDIDCPISKDNLAIHSCRGHLPNHLTAVELRWLFVSKKDVSLLSHTKFHNFCLLTTIFKSHLDAMLAWVV